VAPVLVEAFELVRFDLPLARPLTTAAGTRTHREVLLVHARAAEADGWAECPVEPEPTYDPEFSAAALLAIRDHLLPLAWAGPTGDGPALERHLGAVRGHHMARSAVALAVLDAQLKAAGRSLASWLGATETAVAAGATLSSRDDTAMLLWEAQEVLRLGAARLRVKVRPRSTLEPLRALRDTFGPDLLVQADANGSFDLTDPMHVAELKAVDELGLACLEQPLDPADLLGHAQLSRELRTPICLDESLTSIGAIEAAAALEACSVACLKPSRLGGWATARAAHDRCVELGLRPWVGGMLETAIGRAANQALAALPGMALPADLDPRGWFGDDLAEIGRPGPYRTVEVSHAPGACPTPDLSRVESLRRTTLLRP